MAQDKKVGLILGLGLDGQDGHVRLTKAPNFRLIGGSEETHQRMQETCIKFNEKLDARGKPLESLEPGELRDLAAECGMPLARPDEPTDRRH